MGLDLDEHTRAKLALLRSPEHFGSGCRGVSVIETHFAWVFVGGRFAYKLKKPIRQGPMDYRTLVGRELGCRAELALNRRLAGAVYLCVLPIRRARTGRLVLGGRGQIIDWVVKMRRLPATRMLDRAVLRGVSIRESSAVAAVLVRFFRRAIPRPMSDFAYRRSLRQRTRAYQRELRRRDLHLPAQLVRRVTTLQLALLRHHPELFRGRGARLIDGHGDLRAEHVYLGARSASAPRGAAVIDCLEFDPALRRLDPAEEISQLQLECTRLGATPVGARLVAQYRSQLPDELPDPLLEFYMSQRATVHALFAAWHLRDRRFAGKEGLYLKRARSYLQDALRCVRRALSALESPAHRRHGSRRNQAPSLHASG